MKTKRRHKLNHITYSKKEIAEMLPYIIPFSAYALIITLSPYIGCLYADIAKIILVGGLLIYYIKEYTELSIKWSWSALAVGIIIFLIWAGPEVIMNKLSVQLPSWYGASSQAKIFTGYKLILRLIASILIAPVVEELFVRSFLIRVLVSNKFKSVRIGQFEWLSFIATVLFFGLSHKRWLVGIITGIILNLYLYKKKDVFACIQAHAWSNLLLAVLMIITNKFIFW